MKKIIILSLFLAFVFSTSLSMAQSYPATCDSTAQAVINGIGGCSKVDCNTYSNICVKCCAVEVASNSNLIIYALIAVVIIALAIWQILKRKKTKTISHPTGDHPKGGNF